MRNPVLQIYDNVLTNPDEYRQKALEQPFNQNEQYYKGYRSATTFPLPQFHQFFEKALGRKIPEWNKYETNGRFHVTWSGMQKVFHSDPQQFAAALYLSPEAPLEGGTSLWSSVQTKLRRAPTPENPNVEQLMTDTYHNKLLDQTAWQRCDTVGNVYNRLALWDARYIHSVNEHFGHDLATGRLVQLFFFDTE